MNRNTTLGPRIQKLRKEKKLTLRELGERVNLSITFLSDIEHCRSMPSLDTLEALAKEFEVSVGYLLDGNGVEFFESKDLNELLIDFDRWPQEDKDELIAYLKVKQLSRSHKIK